MRDIRAREDVENLQNDLFGFGFEPGPSDGAFGPKGIAALEAFQAVALGPLRVADYRRGEHEIIFCGAINGVCDASTRREIQCWKDSIFSFVAIGDEYVERRVRVAFYASLSSESEHLVDIPTAPQYPRQRLYVLAAKGLQAMAAEANADIGVQIQAQSGWRPHRWRSRAHYEETIIKRYGSVSRGRRYLAFASPHETGLALDIGSEGLSADSSTIETQRQTAVHKWLVANAWRFGWRPYLAEPWHCEFPISFRAWEGAKD